jgi:hypothetical protein
MILPSGVIDAMNLAAGEVLLVRDDDAVTFNPDRGWLPPRDAIPVRVELLMSVADDASLQILLEADPWNSHDQGVRLDRRESAGAIHCRSTTWYGLGRP